jgi:hypothetical protein
MHMRIFYKYLHKVMLVNGNKGVINYIIEEITKETGSFSKLSFI